MSFTTPLQVQRVEDVSSDGRGTWVLLAPLGYESALMGLCTVPAGFLTDFASVPRLPVVFFLVGGLAHGAAIVHDYLYTTHSVTRAVADAVFREAVEACGVSAWRAWIMWLGVRAGGGASWDRKPKESADVVA